MKRACLRTLTLALALISTVSGCGDGTSPTTTCTVSIRGGVNENTTCTTAPAATFVAAQNAGAFTLAVATGGAGTTVSVNLGFNGQPAVATTYTESSPGASGGVTVQAVDTATSAWEAVAASAGSPAIAAQGTFDLSFTNLGAETDTSQNATWTSAHGSLSASLAPEAGTAAFEAVTFRADF